MTLILFPSVLVFLQGVQVFLLFGWRGGGGFGLSRGHLHRSRNKTKNSTGEEQSMKIDTLEDPLLGR